MQKKCIIIPCYNEEKRLQLDKFISFLKKNSNTHFLFVNDGSSDNTKAILTEVASTNDRVHFLDLSKNQGKGEAVRQGMLKAFEDTSFDIIGFLDADLSTPLEEIPKLATHLKNDVLFVFGARIKKIGAFIDRKVHRHILGRIFATAVSLTLHLNVYDTQCGIKLFKRKVVFKIFETPFLSKWIFDIEIFHRFSNICKPKTINHTAIEVPISVWKDVNGSKLKLIDFLKVPFELLLFIKKKR
ncbi:glycosyltransferase [Aquimarina agarivorans]|uniref:glycosyltransferase n=1 Tax=Aquimarina agarivorans TaxID=980584 RepID=UPI000248ED74|nr:glycosyltransferase [Aquimarina agarivorans]